MRSFYLDKQFFNCKFLKKEVLFFKRWLIENLEKGLKAVDTSYNNGQFVYTLIIRPKYLINICLFLKYQTQLQYKTLIDIVAVDYPLEKKRFSVVYNLLSTLYNTRIFIRCEIPSFQPLFSLTKLFSVSGWFEREVWDMFGIFFINNKDLRRILTDYGFNGYPFRKDFPLTGFTELRYDENQKRIVSEPLELSQEYRCFDFL